MLDMLNRRRRDFVPGPTLRLADGRAWPLPAPEPDDLGLDEMIAAIVEADRPEDLLRAELALGIHLIAVNYDLPPLILGALLDFPPGDAGLAAFQDDLHAIAMLHARGFERQVCPYAEPRLPRFSRRFGLFRRADASMSA